MSRFVATLFEFLVVDVQHEGSGGCVRPDLLRKAILRNELLRPLDEVTVDHVRSLDLTALAELTVKRASELLGATAVALSRWDPTANFFTVLAAESTTFVPLAPAAPQGEGLIGTVFARAQPMIIDDYPSWDGTMPAAHAVGLQSAAAAPLLVRNQAHGVLAAYSCIPAAFRQEHLEILTLLAAQLAIAFEALER